MAKLLKCVSNDFLEKRLTVGRVYEVVATYYQGGFESRVDSYLIVDDLGAKVHYSPVYFLDMEKIARKDAIVEEVKAMFDERSKRGIDKYGTTLEENNTDDFLIHLQEELMDGILYLTKIRKQLKEKQL